MTDERGLSTVFLWNINMPVTVEGVKCREDASITENIDAFIHAKKGVQILDRHRDKLKVVDAEA